MKHQYFGDVNDYRKYGLLRCLVESTGVRVGVCWMLTAPDGRRDGRKTEYLRTPAAWKRYDPELFDLLHRFVHKHKQRSLEVMARQRIIPRARYFSSMLTDDRQQRSAYFASMHSSLQSADLIFFDPDNGLEVNSVRLGSRGSSKYLYWHEVAETWESGKGILLYQHFPRVQRNNYVASRVKELAGVCKGAALYAFGTAHVLFLAALANPASPRFPALVQERWKGQIGVGYMPPCEGEQRSPLT